MSTLPPVGAVVTYEDMNTESLHKGKVIAHYVSEAHDGKQFMTIELRGGKRLAKAFDWNIERVEQKADGTWFVMGW